MRSQDLLVPICGAKKLMVGAIGFEPTTPCAQGRKIGRHEVPRRIKLLRGIHSRREY
jgi:hypothetical protein